MWITIDDNHVIISNTLWNFSWNSNLYDLYALFNGPCEKFLIKTRVVFVYKECKECWSCEKKKRVTCCLTRCTENGLKNRLQNATSWSVVRRKYVLCCHWRRRIVCEGKLDTLLLQLFNGVTAWFNRIPYHSGLIVSLNKWISNIRIVERISKFFNI